MDALLIIIIVGMCLLMLGLSVYLLIVYVHRKGMFKHSRRQGLGNGSVLQTSGGYGNAAGVVTGVDASAGRGQQPPHPELRRHRHEDILVGGIHFDISNDHDPAALRHAVLRN